MNNRQIEQAAALMAAFTRRSGLTTNASPTRYLWTDAFAVCNFVGLARATGDDSYRRLARRLVDQVHETLGRHREDDARSGWLSGLDDEAARDHPTQGGLRIGKPLPERDPDAPLDERLEWERDGQYFHYLTKWMHALDVMARASGQARFVRWAQELAKAAAAAFVYEGPSGRPRMVWKMSIDLSRPLVTSMGHHDPLDGTITMKQVQATAVALPHVEPNLHAAIQPFLRMIQGRDWGTADPLGLGGLLMDAARLSQLIRRGQAEDRPLLDDLIQSAEQGIRRWVQTDGLSQRAERRLAFRELGLAIGLQGVGQIQKTTSSAGTLDTYQPLAERIISFWLESDNQRSRTWAEHEDINAVMLATALVPSGFLVLPEPGDENS